MLVCGLVLAGQAAATAGALEASAEASAGGLSHLVVAMHSDGSITQAIEQPSFWGLAASSGRECGGIAPAVTSCSNYLPYGWVGTSHGFRVPLLCFGGVLCMPMTAYSGTLTSTVKGTVSGSMTLTCESPGTLFASLDCKGVSKKVTLGSEVVQSCRSGPYPSLPSPFGFPPIPGGAGPWTCWLVAEHVE